MTKLFLRLIALMLITSLTADSGSAAAVSFPIGGSRPAHLVGTANLSSTAPSPFLAQAVPPPLSFVLPPVLAALKLVLAGLKDPLLRPQVMPASAFGLQRKHVLGTSPFLEELVRAYLWHRFGFTAAAVFSVGLVALHYYQYLWTAWSFYVASAWREDSGFWRSILVVVKSTGYSLVTTGFALHMFSAFQDSGAASKEYWGVVWMVNWGFHFLANAFWVLFIEEGVRRGRSVLMPSSLWGVPRAEDFPPRATRFAA